MKPLIEIKADVSNKKNFFDLSKDFLNSAVILYGSIADGVSINQKNQLGKPSDEFWHGQLVPTLYLLRHALELSIKALIEEVKGTIATGHDLEKLWQENMLGIKKSQEINLAFQLLDKYSLLNDEQLFRYPHNKGGKKLSQLLEITNEDLEILLAGVRGIHHEVLIAAHHKKGLPL